MAKVSLNQAAKDTGVHISTLSRWRKSGKITAEKNDNGSYLLDTSEYDRIRTLRTNSPKMQQLHNTEKRDITTAPQTDILEQKIAMLEQQLHDKKEEAAKLWERLEQADIERNKLTAVITDISKNAQNKPVEHRKSLWATLLGKIP